MVAHEQQNPVAGNQSGCAHPLGQSGTAGGPLAMRGMDLRAVENGGTVGCRARVPRQQVGEAHDEPPTPVIGRDANGVGREGDA